ncbi:hypothetical protein ABEB36_011351 [Hypothenemus hampei]|uniref:Sarcalumenin n=1 Tax=Hypothenemus hampei TaxID=57062 RepID=A0ABD1EF67_HYPHA
MEVYPRSSWFLLLLGFALIAATLQETTDCPTPDQVSCTSGTKCNAQEDCEKNEICCANSCYTKRCISITKGETDGPTETDCRPYIEKALKELEIGEAGYAQTEPSEKYESAEDVPTVEITDDSSHQEVDGEGDASDESKGVDDKSVEEEQVQQEVEEEQVQQEVEEEQLPKEIVQEEVDKSDEKVESDEQTKTEPSKEESAEQTETADEESLEEENVEEQTTHKAASEESPEVEEPSIVKRDVPVAPVESIPIQTTGDSEEDKTDEVEQPSKESAEEHNLDSTETNVSKEEAEDQRDSKEDEKSEEAASSKEDQESAEEGGCPQPNELSCTEGELCTKHRHCGENQICCTNKCYRKRCTSGTVSQAELDAESESVESEEEKSEEKQAPNVPETGCPSPNEVSCTEGELCNKHKQCHEDHICCPNKCYRKRCIPGTATSAELAEESDEESEEEADAPAAAEKPSETRPDTGCPIPSEVSCVEGDLCSKHRHCGQNEICCPNKCYRKRCTSGTPTEEDLADEESSEEDAQEDVKDVPVQTASRKDTGCPERDQVPCGGEQCTRNKECGTGEICCANKCYRKICLTGTPGSDEDDDDDESEEKSKEEPSAEAAPESQEEEGGCPSPDKLSCTEGERCGDDDDCDNGEICCSNKCYNKRCVPGTKPGKDISEEESAEAPTAPPPPPSRKQKESIKIEVKKESKRASTPPPPPPPPPAPKKSEIKKPVSKKLEPKIVQVLFEEPSSEEDESVEKGGAALVEELSLDTDVPSERRSRDHVEHLLKLDKESTKLENVQNRVYEETLKELKRLYENAIKPLEVLYKYRDLSNRHFGDAEIFSKPLVLFMGPWSGGKSSIINYLTNNEYNETALRTGAEPSPAYFNILMYGEEPEIIDGTELAADFTFSGLQKFGQGLEERLRGVKLPSKLLDKVNIVEIPGILEVRKQVSRLFPFNDACQWFIDRADIIFLVYDPSKLDVGPETEAILDQLKGREHQTRIILNKADQVKPEELMRVQGALIWNISPLMSSPQPPAMYTTSLWSRPYESWAPVKLLQAQERSFLRDLRTAIDRRVENKISSARRFAVRVRNHAKMVDCYLTTYYNHKSVFGNRKQVANEIIDHPQDYHIYEGLSTLTNISRYDLPDPEVYRDFFKLNPLYEFQQLSATCTYFRGCPINRLDIAIAYDLPELVGTYKRNLEEAIVNANNPPKESVQSSKKTKKTAPGS